MGFIVGAFMIFAGGAIFGFTASALLCMSRDDEAEELWRENAELREELRATRSIAIR